MDPEKDINRFDLDRLAAASHLEGTETGSFWSILGELWDGYEDHFSDNFREALRLEIIGCINDLDENYTIVEEEYQPPPIKTTKLKYID